jgi:hypothetical protein
MQHNWYFSNLNWLLHAPGLDLLLDKRLQCGKAAEPRSKGVHSLALRLQRDHLRYTANNRTNNKTNNRDSERNEKSKPKRLRKINKRRRRLKIREGE